MYHNSGFQVSIKKVIDFNNSITAVYVYFTFLQRAEVLPYLPPKYFQRDSVFFIIFRFAFVVKYIIIQILSKLAGD